MDMTRKKEFLLLSAVLAGLVAVAVLYRQGLFSLSSVSELRDYIQNAAPYSHLVFFLLQLLSVIFAPVPSNVSALAGGMLFGTLQAFLLTFLAVFLGSALVFSLARYLGREFAQKLAGQRLPEQYREALRSRTATFLFLAFLFPYFPDDVLCILAGLTAISPRRFLAIVALARPWGLLFACALGGTSISFPFPVLVLLGVAGIILFLLGMKYGPAAEQTLLRRFSQKPPFGSHPEI